MSQQRRAVFSAPIVMLNNVAKRNIEFVQLHSSEQRGALVRRLLIDTLVFANFDPNALRITSMRAGMPAYLADWQTLID